MSTMKPDGSFPDDVAPGIIEYVFGFPRFRMGMMDFYVDDTEEPAPFVPPNFLSKLANLYKETDRMKDTQYKPISADHLTVLQRNLRAEEDRLLLSKGRDYTADSDDRVTNFITDAKELGLNPRMVWAVHFRKQVAAIMTWAKTGRVASESLFNRMVDLRNYALLGLALNVALDPVLEGKEITECPPPKTD